jgi:6-phosphogluconolactonase (cycloisomerase 2 family)
MGSNCACAGANLSATNSAASAVTTYLVAKSSKSVTPLQTFTFTLPAKGPNPDRQEAPHPHQAIVHPNGNFVLVPDLGADLVRVFSVDKNTKKLTEVDPLVAAPGSGPRHAAFGKMQLIKRGKGMADEGLFLYLVSELSNTVTVYKTSCAPGGAGLKFEQVQVTDTFAGKPVPSSAAAAEVALSVRLNHNTTNLPSPHLLTS